MGRYLGTCMYGEQLAPRLYCDSPIDIRISRKNIKCTKSHDTCFEISNCFSKILFLSYFLRSAAFPSHFFPIYSDELSSEQISPPP